MALAQALASTLPRARPSLATPAWHAAALPITSSYSARLRAAAGISRDAGWALLVQRLEQLRVTVRRHGAGDVLQQLRSGIRLDGAWQALFAKVGAARYVRGPVRRVARQ